MARNADDVENYLRFLGRNFDRREESGPEGSGPDAEATFLVQAGEGTVIAVRVAPPIVAVNVAIGPAPVDDQHQLRVYRRMLELNATDLMHSAYGLERGAIVLSAALALDNLDANELDATLSDMDVALIRHTKELVEFART